VRVADSAMLGHICRAIVFRLLRNNAREIVLTEREMPALMRAAVNNEMVATCDRNGTITIRLEPRDGA
jgi:hypothetical protein